MTREEAKDVFLNRGYIKVDGGTVYSPDKWREACVDISDWLEQEPCEDAISRQAVLDAMYALCDKAGTLRENPWRDNPHIDAIIDVIGDLPPVTPQQRMGKWIAVENEETETVGYYCSECDLPMETEYRTKFCPNCGSYNGGK